MYNTMFRRIVVFYFCIVSLILSYKVGNKNVVENSESSGELCSLIKEGETFKITDVLASANILSYLEVVKDEHFLYTTTFSIKAFNIIDINSTFTAKRDTSITTHSLSISLKDSLKYESQQLVGYQILLSLQKATNEAGLPKIDNSGDLCSMTISFNGFSFNVIMFKYKNSSELYFMPLLNNSILPEHSTSEYSVQETGSADLLNLLPLVFKVQLEDGETKTSGEVMKKVKIALIVVFSVIGVVTIIAFGSFFTTTAKQ